MTRLMLNSAWAMMIVGKPSLNFRPRSGLSTSNDEEKKTRVAKAITISGTMMLT